MEVVYTDHLKTKLRARSIPDRLPERIYGIAKSRFFNHVTLRHIAVASAVYQRKRRLLMIAFDQWEDRVEIITIHPITRQQIRDRVLTGRWSRESTQSDL